MHALESAVQAAPLLGLAALPVVVHRSQQLVEAFLSGNAKFRIFMPNFAFARLSNPPSVSPLFHNALWHSLYRSNFLPIPSSPHLSSCGFTLDVRACPLPGLFSSGIQDEHHVPGATWHVLPQ